MVFAKKYNDPFGSGKARCQKSEKKRIYLIAAARAAALSGYWITALILLG
jgi:hypothetical protein